MLILMYFIVLSTFYFSKKTLEKDCFQNHRVWCIFKIQDQEIANDVHRKGFVIPCSRRFSPPFHLFQVAVNISKATKTQYSNQTFDRAWKGEGRREFCVCVCGTADSSIRRCHGLTKWSCSAHFSIVPWPQDGRKGSVHPFSCTSYLTWVTCELEPTLLTLGKRQEPSWTHSDVLGYKRQLLLDWTW